MTKFIMKLCARFMKLLALQGRKVHDILYKDPLNQLPGNTFKSHIRRYTCMLIDLKYTFWEDCCYELGDIFDVMEKA